MESAYISWIMLFLLILLVIVGCPVAIALGSVGIIFALWGWGTGLVSMFPDRLFTTMQSFELAAITLFILMGVTLESSGVSNILFESLRLMFARIRGGLYYVILTLATLLGACTGISGASVVTLGMISYPTMMKYKYDKALTSGLICSGGGLAVIIPPSIMLVIYGPIAGLSVADLFTAALIPGLLLSFSYFLYVWVRCRLQPHVAPEATMEEKQLPIKQLAFIFCKSFLPTGIVIFGVLGSILFGLASPTEAAGVGALLSFLVALTYKSIKSWSAFLQILYTTIRVCSMVMLIVVCAGIFTSVFIGLGGADLIKMYLLKLSGYPTLLLVVMLGIVLFLGFFMDWIAILYITAPVYRGVIMQMGWDPLWFAILFCITLQISYVTPPFSYSVFYLKGIAPKEITLTDMYRGVIPFIPVQCAVLVLLYYIPQLSLWLVSAVK